MASLIVAAGNARQCNCRHVIANQTGKVGFSPDYGHSRIIDPTGNVIADQGDGEGMVVVQTGLNVDPAALKR